MANYTDKAIHKFFQEMLIEMPFGKITVSALVARCEISSNTFYYHYKDIYDLLDTWLEIKKNEFIRETEGLQGWDNVLKAFLHKLKDNSKIVYHISDSITRDMLERYIFTSLKGSFVAYMKKIQSEKTHIDKEVIMGLSEVLWYSLLGITLEFIWGHMETDVNRQVDRLRRVFDDVMKQQIER